MEEKPWEIESEPKLLHRKGQKLVGGVPLYICVEYYSLSVGDKKSRDAAALGGDALEGVALGAAAPRGEAIGGAALGRKLLEEQPSEEKPLKEKLL